METINVLVTNRIGEGLINKISAIDERLRVYDISEMIQSENKGDNSNKERLNTLLAEVDILCGFIIPKDLISRAPRLKWAQMMSAGVDRLVGSELWESPVTITNVSGVTAVPISEFVLSLMLMFVKQAPLCFELKARKEWKWVNLTVLRSKSVGIVGLGSIGREVARLAKAFGMEVLATRRTVKKQARARYVDHLLPPQQLHQLLERSDFVVLTLPLTQDTNKLIGEKELFKMKSSAYLINISRGGIVDEPALVKALEEKRIAGAGLDVFATEPLPSESKLWDLKNVIYSPHASGGMEDYMVQAVDVFIKNLKRYLQGKKLFNVIDKKNGY